MAEGGDFEPRTDKATAAGPSTLPVSKMLGFYEGLPLFRNFFGFV